MAEKQYGWLGLQGLVKRLADLFFSILFLIILSPVLLIISILVLINSGFPIMYSQKRVGKFEQPFSIYKFRTMRIDAEVNGPKLSGENDDRVTGVGKILRKWRLDELPQFFNVLLGDMSLVGPRPERRHFVDLLKEDLEDYQTIFAVKPGITSKGMVNYGYASSLEEMKARAPYDINYVKDLRLGHDLEILFQTIKTLAEGSGK